MRVDETSASAAIGGETVVAPARGKLLVADDDPEGGTALSALLRADGFDVTLVPDGAAVLACVDEKHFDAVITDVCMPEVDGLTLVRRLRAARPDLIVVVMSGTHRSGTTAIEDGAVAFVPKPFHIDEIVGVIDAAIQLREERRETGRGARSHLKLVYQ